MGLFDFLKNNKNIITDNGTNLIYENEGKGKLKEKFNKVNGVLHGDFIKYWNGEIIEKYEYLDGIKLPNSNDINEKLYWDSNRNFINKLIEIDDLISLNTGIKLISKMSNHTIISYVKLIMNKYSMSTDEEFLRVYIFYKRNYLIRQLIISELIDISEYDFNKKFSNHLNCILTDIDLHLSNFENGIYYHDKNNRHIRFIGVNPLRNSLKDKLININLFNQERGVLTEYSFQGNSIHTTKKNYPLSHEIFMYEIVNYESILFGLNFETYILINQIVNNKSLDKIYRVQGGVLNPDKIIVDDEEFELLISNLLDEIEKLCFSNKINLDEILFEINNINFQDYEKKAELKINNTLNAVEFYERGIDKDSNSDYEGAIIDFTKAIEINGEYIDSYRGRASARIWLNDYEGVINDYTKIIELNSIDIDAYESRGLAKTCLKDYIGAIEDFNKTIELDKESKVYSSRGRMKKNLLDFDGALLDYNIAVEKYPEDFSNYFGRGELKYEIADYHGANKDFNKCTELKPNRIISFHKRGDCRLKIEDYKGAIEDYSMVIQNRQYKYGVTNPSSENAIKMLASIYHNRGIARSKIKEYNDAIEDIKTALEFDPNFDDAIQLLKSLKG